MPVHTRLGCKKPKEHAQRRTNKMLPVQKRKKSYAFSCGNVGGGGKGLGIRKCFLREALMMGKVLTGGES